MINGSAMSEVRVFVESGNLVSGIRDFSLSILLEKVELAKDGSVMKLMFKGRRSQVAEEDGIRIFWIGACRVRAYKFRILSDMVNQVSLGHLDISFRWLLHVGYNVVVHIALVFNVDFLLMPIIAWSISVILG